MSSGAAVALRAALAQTVGQLEKIAASGQEAATLLEANRVRVVQDITNPGPKNIDGKDLTQKHLTRVGKKDQDAVDAMVREVCQCLRGKAAMSPPPSPSAFKVW